MKKFIFFLVLVTLIYSFWPYQWTPVKWWTAKATYAQIKDITHPTQDDFFLLQKFLSKGRRPELALLKDMEKRCRSFRIIGEKKDETPEEGVVHVNCDANHKENCLLIYASFNKGFPKGLKRLVEFLKKSDYKGHILYRIGGWPNIEEGDLSLAHVPYAFKPCFFREAKSLGYKRALWLDTSIIPVVSLNRIFAQIEENGYFVMGGSHRVQPFINREAAVSLGVDLKECSKIPSCSAGLFGIDLQSTVSWRVVENWYQAARDPNAFFSERSDQNALSIILYKLGMMDKAPIETLVEAGHVIPKNALFIIDRNLVHEP